MVGPAGREFWKKFVLAGSESARYNLVEMLSFHPQLSDVDGGVNLGLEMGKVSTGVLSYKEQLDNGVDLNVPPDGVETACQRRSSLAYLGVEEDNMEATFFRLTRAYDFLDERNFEDCVDGQYVEVRRLSFVEFLACDDKRVPFWDLWDHRAQA